MDYEKKYKDALERARKLHSEYRTIVGVNIPEEIFPELKESEDERIKKQIRELLLDSPSNDLCRIGIDVEKTLAWFEKQDNKLDADKVIEWIEEHVPTKFEDMQNYVENFRKAMKGE